MNANNKILSVLLAMMVFMGGIGGIMPFAEAGAQAQGPQRIIVLPVFAEEILFEMIGPDRIIGLWHDYMKGGEAYTPTMELTKGKESWLELEDTERIIALDADLVIAWNANYDLSGAIATLAQAGIDVLLVDTPVTFDDVREAIRLLGGAVAAQEAAAAMLRDFDAQCEQLARAIASIPEAERIRVSDYRFYMPLRVYNETLANAAGVISDGGAIFVPNVFSQEIDMHRLAQWNPDLITFRPYMTDSDGSLYEIHDEIADGRRAGLLEDPALAGTSAVKSKNIHPLCIHESQYMIQSAIDLAMLAYPDLAIEK